MAKKENSGMKVVDITQLKKYAEGEIVELPEFGEGKPFIAKLRRPSLMALAKNGKIPNGLLETANSLVFSGLIWIVCQICLSLWRLLLLLALLSLRGKKFKKVEYN